MNRFTEVLFSRAVGFPVLMISSGAISSSVILRLFGFDTGTLFMVTLIVMLGYSAASFIYENLERNTTSE